MTDLWLGVLPMLVGGILFLTRERFGRHLIEERRRLQSWETSQEAAELGLIMVAVACVAIGIWEIFNVLSASPLQGLRKGALPIAVAALLVWLCLFGSLDGVLTIWPFRVNKARVRSMFNVPRDDIAFTPMRASLGGVAIAICILLALALAVSYLLWGPGAEQNL